MKETIDREGPRIPRAGLGSANVEDTKKIGFERMQCRLTQFFHNGQNWTRSELSQAKNLSLEQK